MSFYGNEEKFRLNNNNNKNEETLGTAKLEKAHDCLSKVEVVLSYGSKLFEFIFYF
jgi:hypothetical protein